MGAGYAGARDDGPSTGRGGARVRQPRSPWCCVLNYKKRRLGPRIVEAARSGGRYRDVHVFIGGTGAVGGTALLSVLDMYEEMMRIRMPEPHEVPILVTTGMGPDDIKAFSNRLHRHIEARWGREHLPQGVRDGYLTRSGVYIAIERLKLDLLAGLAGVNQAPPDERPAIVRDYLRSIGTSAEDDPDRVFAALEAAMRRERPVREFLLDYRRRHLADRPEGFTYRSVVVGIPLPSLVAYRKPALQAVAAAVPGFGKERFDALVHAFEVSVRDDVAATQGELVDHLLMAHTTAVGGMYDTDHGRRTPRLGFAHSAVDTKLAEKHAAAEAFTRLYAEAGVRMLITAAGIGVDEVQINSAVPIHAGIQQQLFDHPRELFPGSKEAMPTESRRSRDAGRTVPRRQMARCFRPVSLRLSGAEATPLSFDRGEDIRPGYVIRSGENGYFSVANADALYRVMRVASASELGLVLATVGLLGDDPEKPWFTDSICYYTETDNARQVFDFIAQPALLRAQIDGLEPMSLQDLGDSRHQGELHMLGLLILLHRLRTLDLDAIPPYVDLDHFEPRSFFSAHSQALTFEDLVDWPLADLARDLRTLVKAERPEDLEPLAPFKARSHAGLFPRKARARLRVLEEVMKAAWNVACLGTPILYEEGGETWARCGWYAAPLDRLLPEADSLEKEIARLHASSGAACDLATFRDHLFADRGFIDLRPHAILSSATSLAGVSARTTLRVDSEAALREALDQLEPYSAFATCGLLALRFRLGALHARLEEAMIELGTLQDHRWHMPRNAAGHHLLVPGIVEAFRHVAEGREKVTGTERVDGPWGYVQRPPPDRRSGILMPPPRGAPKR